jgi:hypothetical protein
LEEVSDFSSSKCPEQHCSLPWLLSMVPRTLSSAVMWPEHEADQSISPRPRIRMGGAITIHLAESWTLLEVDQKYLKSFKGGAREEWRISVGPIA